MSIRECFVSKRIGTVGCSVNEPDLQVIRGQKVPSNVQTPGKGLGSSGALAREVKPTSDMKIVTTEMPATHQVTAFSVSTQYHSPRR